MRNQKKGTDRDFFGYGGHKLEVLGTFESDIVVNTKSANAKFYVMTKGSQNLIGHDTATAMGILKIETNVCAVQNETEFSKIKGVTLDIPIVEKVNGPSKWVSPLVVAPQGENDVRICVDMRRANEAVQRTNHIMPTFDDFLPRLKNARFFSKVDIKNAFHQVV